MIAAPSAPAQLDQSISRSLTHSHSDDDDARRISSKTATTEHPRRDGSSDTFVPAVGTIGPIASARILCFCITALGPSANESMSIGGQHTPSPFCPACQEYVDPHSVGCLLFRSFLALFATKGEKAWQPCRGLRPLGIGKQLCVPAIGLFADDGL